MFSIDRRSLLRGGVASGAVLLAAPFIRRAQAADVLTLYNGQHRATTEALVAAYTKATGGAVTMRNAESPELASQLIEEGDRSPADLFYSEQSLPIAAVGEKGMLARIDDSTLKMVPAKYNAKDGTWMGASVRTRVISYNRKMITEAELPKSIMDVATPAFKGRVAYVKGDGFQEQVMAIVHIKGRDAALQWLKGLRENGRSYNGNRIASTAVNNGEIAMALSNNYYWYSLVREKGGPDKVDVALYSFPGDDVGNIYAVSAAGILKTTRNMAAAQKFIAFMAGKDGQEAMASTSAEYPVIEGVSSPFPLPPLSRFSAPVTPADMGGASQAYALMREAGMI